MAFGDSRGNLSVSLGSITNPTVATGSIANVAVGDLIFGLIAQQTNLTATTTITDNLGNTYAYVNAGSTSTVSGRAFYSRVTAGGTLTTVNIPATASTNDASAIVVVIEGPFATSPLDANPANTTDGTTPFTCAATGTLAQASEVVMAAFAVSSNQTPAASSPASACGNVARANASSILSRNVVSSTSTTTPGFTGTSAAGVQIVASFKRELQTYNETPTESMSLSDSSSTVAVTANTAVLESSTLSDSTTTAVTINAPVTESISLTESLTVDVTVNESITESITLADSYFVPGTPGAFFMVF